jgi:beta-N-acetylhexosaminidase
MKKLILSVILLLSFLRTDYAAEPDSLDSQIGQMLLIGFRGSAVEPDSYISRVIRDLDPGGVILFDFDAPSRQFPRNILDPVQVRQLTSDLKQLSPSLMIAIDAEGGRVNRLKSQYGFLNIPGHQELGNSSPDSTFRYASLLARQLNDLGIDVNLAPVVDLDINPDNPVIGKLGRSFSKDERIVFAHAKAYILAHHTHGVLTAVKHFPGHGSASGDTHLGLTDVTETYQEREIIPYQLLIRENLADMVITSHIVNKNIDPDDPVTLSDHYIREILRDRLGYDGVVISDDLQMGAITDHYSFEESVLKSIRAGCDMILLSNNGRAYGEDVPYKAAEIILEALGNGTLERERILRSLERIRQLKARL